MMTTLQIVLAIVGVVLIGAIVVYNLVQERRFRKEADRMFSHHREDIMLGESVRADIGGEGIKPRISFSEEEATAPEVTHALQEAEADYLPLNLERVVPATSVSEPATMPEPKEGPVQERGHQKADQQAEEPPARQESKESEAAPAATPAAGRQAREAIPPAAGPVVPSTPSFAPAVPKTVSAEEPEEATQAPRGSGLDADTEYVARIRFATPSAPNYGPLLNTLRRIGKPVRAFGKRLDGIWEPLTGHPRVSYDQVEIGLQLADRNGAATHDQLDAFCRALYGFAAEEGGAVSCPDKQDALQAAKSLDMLCMEVDVLIGLNIISSDSRPFTSEVIHKEAGEAHLVLEADGSYHARDAFGHTLFTLTNQEEHPFPKDGRGLTVHGLTLLFDIPRVADGLAVFDRMTRFGFDLAWRLEGRLVDDNGRTVSEDTLNRDRARLAAFYGRMEARGIPAGGERALRLFV
jgi:FtsZ-interacting cell division protein ZipA